MLNIKNVKAKLENKSTATVKYNKFIQTNIEL